MPSTAKIKLAPVSPPQHGVAVVIAAHNAAPTIAAAIRSALAEPETFEVVVVNDASTDGTAQVALAAAQGDPRLRVLTCETNLGPAAARNVAISASSAPVLALLDSDDVFVSGRLSRLLAQPNWDFIADNIAFVPEGDPLPDLRTSQPIDAPLSALDLAGFVRGNIPSNHQERSELGFLKPLIRRDFLDKAALRYDANLRLGEDYDLYVRALMAGARFLISHQTGYIAFERQTSLSGQHGADHLAQLARVARGHLSALPRDHGAWPSMDRLYRSIRARYLHRACLDEKRNVGLGAALSLALSPPSNAVPIARGVLRDKLSATKEQPSLARIRYLMPEAPRLH